MNFRFDKALLIRALLLILLATAVTYDFSYLRVSDDIRVFFPPAKNPEQSLFLGLLQRNASDHHIIAAIRGGEEKQRLETSRKLAVALRKSPLFSLVLNGPSVSSLNDPFLFSHRYHLARPGLTKRFSEAGLSAALKERLREMRSPVGVLNREWLTRDPTGEYLRFLTSLGEGASRPTVSGLWVSPDHQSAMLILKLAKDKPDFATVQLAEAQIKRAFQQAGQGTRLTLSGAPILASEARRIVQGDARKLSLSGTVLVLLFLLLAFRSPLDVLLLGIPLFAGVSVAIGATGLAFGSIHGITISFGVTLIGVAIDYPVHAFSHRGNKASIWPTLMLGVISTLIAFASLFLSGLTGLKQLGLFGVSGLLTAALVTRWLMPPGDHQSTLRFTRSRMLANTERFISARQTALIGMVIAATGSGFLAVKGLPAFDLDFGSLNPLPESIQKQARQLQHDIGKPDAGQLLGVSGVNVEEVLEKQEALKNSLEQLVENGQLGGYEMAAKFLPSVSRQSQQLSALPDQSVLAKNLEAAIKQTPFKQGAFQPFLNDVETARHSAPVAFTDVNGTLLAEKVNALIIDSNGAKAGLISLSPPVDGKALQTLADRQNDVWYIPLRSTAGRLLKNEIQHAVRVVTGGFLLILFIISLRLRSLATGLRIIAAPLASIALVLAFFQLFHTPINLFHLVSLLLIFGLGLDYALFFHYASQHSDSRNNTLVSLLVSAVTTIMVFGVLGISATPALRAIGITVSFGALFSLIFSALFSGGRYRSGAKA